MDIIKIYEATDTNFSTNNGIKSLHPTKCVITHKLNSDYYATIECDISYSEWMIPNNIVVINGQGFRLSNPQIAGNKMTFKAWHVSYDSKNYVIQDIQVDNYALISIASLVSTHIYPTANHFNISSNISDLTSCKFVYQSLYDCIMALVALSDNITLVRDNWNISINATTVIDNQRVIAMGKNIKTYKSAENWDNVCTTLIPIYNDGTMIGNQMLQSEVSYNIPFVKTVTFTPRKGVDTTNQSDVSQDLMEQANAYLTENQYPKLSYTIEPDATLGNVVVGETILLKHPQINQNLTTTVYATEYNALTDKVTKVTFGNFTDDLHNSLKVNISDKFVSMYRDLQAVDTANKSRFEVASNAITAEVQRSTEAEGFLRSQVQLTSNGLASKVEKNGVISSINQSAEQIKIDANKVVLDGLVSFKGLADGTTTINGNCIKTGTLESVVINSGTLNSCIGLTVNGGNSGSSYSKVDTALIDVCEAGYHTYIGGTSIIVNGSRVSLSGHGHNSLDITPSPTASGNIDFAGSVNGASVDYVQDNFERKTSSDVRLKYNIQSLDNVKDKYMAFKPKSYKFKDTCVDDSTHYGLLAQEVEKLDGNLIEKYDTRPYMDEGMYIRDGKAYRIKYEELHGYHIVMIQAQQKQINEQQKQIDELTKMITELRRE